MSDRKNITILIGAVLSVGFLAASLTAMLLTGYYNRTGYQVLGDICGEIIEEQPEAKGAIIAALKDYKNRPEASEKKNILTEYGYQARDLLRPGAGYGMAIAGIGFLAGGTLFLAVLFFRHRKEAARIKTLTDFLEKVNTGGSGILLQTGEDEFSKLQDEIYKTVTALYQTRDAALDAKNNFAENLSNIAHQIKTPITSISLSAQMMKENPSPRHLEQIGRQLSRLTHLEEALLLLSRIDAGTLSLERKEVDVFTVLTLAADNLQELFSKAGVSVDIPEGEGAVIHGDLDWTMEAVMNLFRNCMEHTPPGGTVYCRYEQNPLYTQILIWDTGSGFAKEDIPHLFERFYRGQSAKHGGIGIGLALARAIIESQNGTISAGNLAEGGACYEIRMYCH